MTDIAPDQTPTTPRSAPAPTADSRRHPLLMLENVSKNYGPVEALIDVSFELDQGEVVGLVGDNGAGKSTLVKCVAGVIKPSVGAVHVSGTRHEFENPAQALEAGVETVYQDLALVETFDLAGNLFLGRELVRPGWVSRLGVLRKNEMGEQAREAISQLPSSFPDLDASVDTMSGGQRQAVAISKAAFWGRKLVLLDEPTAALGVKESAGVLEMIGHAAEQGEMGMIVIAHNIVHVFEVCTRIIVLRQGRLVADLRTAETDPDEVVGYITGSR
jgi:ABC-type sugar transport system ATPase subunit